MILGRILYYILVVFEQDIAFGAYLTLQAESREDVDVFKKKEQAFISILSWSIRVQSWESFILILGRILCYILVVFEQDIVFGAYLTLQAESREDVDVFKKKKQAFISILSWKKEKHICVHMILMLLWNTYNKMAAPAPVQLQRPVTVSGLVFCVFVYGCTQRIKRFHPRSIGISGIYHKSLLVPKVNLLASVNFL